MANFLKLFNQNRIALCSYEVINVRIRNKSKKVYGGTINTANDPAHKVQAAQCELLYNVTVVIKPSVSKACTPKLGS